jgi:hypothetical protein
MVKSKENIIRSERMADSLAKSNSRDFWKEVKIVKGKNVKNLPSNVDGVSGNDQIAQVFANKFEKVFNSVGYNPDECKVILDECDKRSTSLSDDIVDSCLMKCSDMDKIILKLKSGKSDGNLGMFSDHVIHGSPLLFKHLVNLFNCMFIHGISPHILLVGTSVPIPKNRNTNNSDNFRGICLQNVLCKIMDTFMLYKEQDNLATSDLQFGFKDKHSTGMANAVVGETLDYYVNKGGEVYMLSLDASKAFDKVNFVKLFEIMLQRNLNPLYTRLLVNMYINQLIRVKFSDSVSKYFSISNGVKQGGVLSPVLFTCYLNGLIENVKKSGYGCHVGDFFTGCVAYADDVVLLAPTVTALKVIISKVEDFAKLYNITFNGKKSKILYCSKENKSHLVNITVNSEKVEQVSSINYLGHIVCTDRNNALVENIVKDFNCKVNNVVASFSGISSVIKHSLYEKYCTSLYGSNFIDFTNNGAINTLRKQWRKAIRRIMCVPPTTHSRYLPHIVGTPPVDILLMQRFIKFFYSGVNSKNSVVSHIFRNAVYSNSRLGRNIKHIVVNYCCTTPSMNCNGMELCRNLYRQWISNCPDEDLRISYQISELIGERDSIVPSSLALHEVKDLIEFLCVS